MTKAEIRAWHERWLRVNEHERTELRAMTIETKLRQLAALMRMARAFGWDKANEADVQPVRDLWVRLKNAARDER